MHEIKKYFLNVSKNYILYYQGTLSNLDTVLADSSIEIVYAND